METGYLLRPQAGKLPPLVSSGKGARLFDADGRDYIDGSSGAIVANLGHGLDCIATAAAQQMQTVAYTYRTQFRNTPAEQLAEDLVNLSKGHARAFLLSSGSEATEGAIRLALQYWQEVGKPSKRRFLSRLVSYHGNTIGSLSLSSDSRRQSISGLTIAEPNISACYCFRCPLRTTPDVCEADCANFLEEAILRAGPQNVAAFVCEPIVGATGGAIVPHQNYFSRIRKICDRYDVLLIVDEVITGLGRTGAWFAMHHWNVVSDITILGKGINAGYTPLAALLVNERISSAIECGTGRVSIGHTHSGNPTSAAVANAVIQYIREHDLVRRARTVGVTLKRSLDNLAAKHAIIGDIRGLGLLWGIEFVADPKTKEPFEPAAQVTDQIVDGAFANGLIVYPCRGLIAANAGDAILVAPPLVITEEELETLVSRLERTLQMIEYRGR